MNCVTLKGSQGSNELNCNKEVFYIGYLIFFRYKDFASLFMIAVRDNHIAISGKVRLSMIQEAIK